MSEWSGFDPRKICPRCGGYQTSLWKQTDPAPSSKRFLWSVILAFLIFFVLLISFIVLSIAKDIAPELYLSAGLFLLVILGSGILFLNRDRISGLKNSGQMILDELKPGEMDSIPSPDLQNQLDRTLVYHLACSNCGHRWKKTSDEWEREGRRELDGFIGQSSSTPVSYRETTEDLREIEWKPPDPRRGVFLFIAAVVLLLVVSIALFGVFWSFAHPNQPYALTISSIALGLMLLVLIGLVFAQKPKAGKIVSLILIVLILLIALIPRLFLK